MHSKLSVFKLLKLYADIVRGKKDTEQGRKCLLSRTHGQMISVFRWAVLRAILLFG